jgi:hypothetical protein
MPRFFAVTFVAFVSLAGAAHGQESAASELLQRVPDDFGVCLVVNDFRGQLDRLGKTPWMPKLKQNPLVQALLAGKEFRDLVNFEAEVKKHLQLDFALLRDDIIGDAVVFAYQPPEHASGEKGLLLVKARNADSLSHVIAKINELQTNIGELTALEARQYKDQVYYRRVHQRAAHFYVQKGTFLAVANGEQLIHEVLDRDPAAPSLRRDLWVKTGLSNAVATLILNPRMFEADLAVQATAKTGPEGLLAQSVLKVWKSLDGVLISLQGDEAPELSLTLAARPGTAMAKLWNQPAPAPSDLWRRFPDNALVSVAGQVDIASIVKQVQALLPEKEARGFDQLILKNLGAIVGLDVAREVFPNIGPDFGFTVTLPEDKGLPRALVAVAVKPAPKETPVDQLLYKTIQTFAGFALFDYNRKLDEPIRTRTVKQGVVEVKHLAHDKLFPPGVEPALALKDGYLLLASAPDAIAAFRASDSPAPPASETPLIKIAPREWSRLITTHRQAMIDHFVEKNKDTPATAGKIVDGLASGFELFQSLNLSQRVGGGQVVWTVRVTPGKN